MHVLIIDRNQTQGTHIKRGLRYENIEADVISFASEDVWKEEAFTYNAVILHVSSPDEDGIRACYFFKNRNAKFPIVIIDDREVKNSKANFMRSGAQVYFGRPFSFRDLAVQIKFLIYKRSSLLRKKILIYKNLRLYLESREAKRNGSMVQLRNKEFSLLEFFMLNIGQVLTRDDILEGVWDRNANILTNTVDVHINMLRKKIDRGQKEKLIQTVPCVGYKFGERQG